MKKKSFIILIIAMAMLPFLALKTKAAELKTFEIIDLTTDETIVGESEDGYFKISYKPGVSSNGPLAIEGMDSYFFNGEVEINLSGVKINVFREFQIFDNEIPIRNSSELIRISRITLKLIEGGYTIETSYVDLKNDRNITFSEVADANRSYEISVDLVEVADRINIDFNTNGGELDKTYYTLKKDANYIKEPIPVKEGYDFAGWFINEDFSDREGRTLDIIDWGESTVLHAKWVLPVDLNAVIYKIIYHTNGGNAISAKSWTKAQLNQMNVDYLLLNDYLVTPTREDHTFLGYYLDQNLEYPVTSDIKIGEDLENQTFNLYAKWQNNQSDIDPDPSDESKEKIKSVFSKIIDFIEQYLLIIILFLAAILLFFKKK